MLLETYAGIYDRTHVTDATDTSFPSRVPTLTEPSGDGVIELGTVDGQSVPNALRLIPIGTGANNAVLTGMRVIGWSPIPGVQGTTRTLWLPIILVEVAAVFGNIPGIASTRVGASYFFMDTITLVGTSGNANISHELVSPANDTMAHLVVDIKGCRKAEVTFDLGANATGMNCLAAKI